LNLSFVPLPQLNVTTNLGFTTSRTHLSRENAGVLRNTRIIVPEQLNTTRRGFVDSPPEVIWNVYEDYQDVKRLITSLNIDHRPLTWLTQRLTLGMDLTGENDQSIVKRMSDFEATFYTPAVALGSKLVARRDVTYSTIDYGASASVPLSGALNSTTSMGLQYYRTLTHTVRATGQQLAAPELTTLDASATTTAGENNIENVTLGIYAQQQAAFNNRLFVTGAVRVDDNSAFGSSFSLVAYPKISASWVVSEEPFWRLPFLDALRLRVAYGASGQQPAAFAALRTFGPIPTGNGTAAFTPRSTGNDELAPERGREIEVGLEAGLFNNSLGIDFTYYHQRTKDAILDRQQPPSLGFPGRRFVNAGEIMNHGMELQIKAIAVNTRRVKWSTTLNLATNDNKVVNLGGDEFIALGNAQLPTGTMQHRVGYPVASWFERKVVSAQVDARGRAFDVLCDGGADSGHMPVPCATAPRLFLGRSQPNVEGALGSTITLVDRLVLSGMVDFKLGHTKDNVDHSNRCKVRLTCYENLDPHASPIVTAEIQDPGMFATSLRLHDASFAKLREISLGYTLPNRWSGVFGATRSVIRISARNLHTWTRWTGLDPESYRGNQLHVRQEQDAVPQLTTFVTTLNLTF
jgi:hypothetical protein